MELCSVITSDFSPFLSFSQTHATTTTSEINYWNVHQLFKLGWGKNNIDWSPQTQQIWIFFVTLEEMGEVSSRFAQTWIWENLVFKDFTFSAEKPGQTANPFPSVSYYTNLYDVSGYL